MIFLKRHSMIDRYLGGRMDAQEMLRFEELLNVDDKLRAMYETDRAIYHALNKDKASIPASHASLEANVMTTLASVGTEPLAGPAAAGGMSTAGSILTSSLMKTVIGVVGGLGILAGITWYVATRGADTMPGNPPEAPQLLAPSPPTLPQQEPVAVEPTQPDSTPAAAHDSAPGRVQTAPANPSDRTADEIFIKRSTDATPGATLVTPDSVHVKLKLDVNRQKKAE